MGLELVEASCLEALEHHGVCPLLLDVVAWYGCIEDLHAKVGVVGLE
jgi:hypothetical protein